MDELTPFEKIIESASQFAAMVRAYYGALIENGFSSNEAMFLTNEYQKEILRSITSKKPG